MVYKFRCWDKENQEMIYEEVAHPFLIIGSCVLRLSPHHKEDLYEIMPDEKYIVMQYIRLNDKNGNEIYSGDVVKCDDDSIYSPSITNHEVIFNNAQFRLKGGKAFNYYATIEVIGNIFKNAELINL